MSLSNFEYEIKNGKYVITNLVNRNLKEVIIPKVGADGTVGANNHNSLATHIETANILANALTTTWGFTVIEPNVTLENYDSVLVKF